MSDPMTDQPLRTAFAELRATHRTGLAPPGVAAAHRTVRRRRLASATAGLIAVIVVGVGLLATASLGQPAPAPERPLAPAAPAPPLASPSGKPDQPPPISVDRSELRQLVADVLYAEWPDRGMQSDAVPVPGQVVDAEEGDYLEGSSSGTGLRPGTYLMAITCGGEAGTIALTAEVGDDRYTATAQCAMTADEIAAGIGEAGFVIEDQGDEFTSVAFTVRADEAAVSGVVRPVFANLVMLLK
jgi:hypothetical protein